MKVKIKLFAGLRESVGFAESEVDLELGQTPLDLWRIVAGDRDLPNEVMTAVNHEYVARDTRLNDGDEVAFFPPVTGG